MVVPPGEHKTGCRRERKLNWTSNEVAIFCRTQLHTRVKWNEGNQLCARRINKAGAMRTLLVRYIDTHTPAGFTGPYFLQGTYVN